MHRHTAIFIGSVALLLIVPSANGLPLWDYFTGVDTTEDKAAGMDTTTMELIEPRQDYSKPLLRYDTVVPILQVVLTPIGRMLWPRVEQWVSGLFGAYLDSANRAIDSISQYATENISFQTGDVYYTKSDMIDGHGHQSLIITLPSGRTITVLTFKTKSKFNVFEEFPQLSETQNEVRELN
ncbi:uncharacterized protein LOC118511026 [Anopheles stephensi]|uniref:uncharacterized protein LOC118511026 n=1 Tax=Anopheles stephensi TaxID=30069 RepID=UPI001658BB0B|nr:uncharacterized protein LOC118511026 [Anopheles stephensi]